MKLQGLWNRYDRAIWVRAFGRLITSMTYFMIRPFLILYLYDKMGVSFFVSTLIIALAPLTEFIVGLFAGSFADRYGRRPMLLISQVIQVGAMIGFFFSSEPLFFAIFTIIYGMGGALFVPAGNAQITDTVAEEHRGEVYALMQTGINIGAGVGPLIAVLMFKLNPAWTFGIGAIGLALHTLLIYLFIPESLSNRLRGSQEHKAPMKKMKIREHPTLLMMTILSVPLVFLYGQVESTFPLHLQTKFVDYQSVFATILAINATSVIVLQMFVVKWTKHFKAMNLILVSYVFFSFTGIGYGLASALAVLIVAELFFTMGEMIIAPHVNKAISLIAPEEYRGRYFGIFQLQWPIGRVLAPLLGGFIFHTFGGATLFFGLSTVLLVIGICWYLLLNRIEKRNHLMNQVNTSA